jgi:predicted DNA-binding transcriptional regulator AlpA
MPELLTMPELAKAINTPVSTLRHWRLIGYGPKSAKLGKHIVYRRQDVDQWVNGLFG